MSDRNSTMVPPRRSTPVEAEQGLELEELESPADRSDVYSEETMRMEPKKLESLRALSRREVVFPNRLIRTLAIALLIGVGVGVVGVRLILHLIQ